MIRTPRISNFTDFLALEHLEEVSLRYVEHDRQLGHPDMILLPGTKNTMGDLKWMRENGMEASILKEADKGNSYLWYLRRLSDAGRAAGRP